MNCHSRNSNFFSYLLLCQALLFEFKEISEQLETLPMKNVTPKQVGEIYDLRFTNFSKTLIDAYNHGKTIPEIAEYKFQPISLN
jgi:hypothetical protein